MSNIPLDLLGGGSLLLNSGESLLLVTTHTHNHLALAGGGDLLIADDSYFLLQETLADIIYDPHGREGIGVDQPQSGTDYPLVQPSADIRYLLADAYLGYEDPADYDDTAQAFALPFTLAWISGLGTNVTAAPGWAPTPTHDVDLVIKDHLGRVVFDSTLADDFQTVVWTDRLTIYEWITADAVCRIVVHTAWPTYGEPAPVTYDTNIVPDNGTLDARVTYRLPKRVKSLRVLLNDIAGDVAFVNGYNTAFEVSPLEGLRQGSRVVFSAPAGAGAGIFPGCNEPDLLLRKINNVQPKDDGSFYLQASDCYYIRQPVVATGPNEVRPSIDLDPTAAHLQIGNDCQPCCKCEDFVAVAKYLNRVRDQYVDLGTQTTAIQQSYHLNVDRWSARRECGLSNPLRLLLRAQACPYMDVAAQFCNQSSSCKRDLELIIRFQSDPALPPTADLSQTACTATVPPLPTDLNAEVEQVCGYTVITRNAPTRTERYTMAGGWSEFRAYWDAVDPFQAVTVRFRLKFPADGHGTLGDGATTIPYAVTATAEIASGGKYLCNPQGLRVTATATATLACPAGSKCAQ